jgi:hypothetical protein
LVYDVAEPLGRCRLTGALEHALGDVDPDNASRRCGARCLASRQPSAAANIEHLVSGTDPAGSVKVLVVHAKLTVVEVRAVRRGHTRDAIDDGCTSAVSCAAAMPHK